MMATGRARAQSGYEGAQPSASKRDCRSNRLPRDASAGRASASVRARTGAVMRDGAESQRANERDRGTWAAAQRRNENGACATVSFTAVSLRLAGLGATPLVLYTGIRLRVYVTV